MARKRKIRNPLKAIRAKCLECCGASPKEVRLCPDLNCALHPFRMGRNPFERRPKGSPRLAADNPDCPREQPANPSTPGLPRPNQHNFLLD